MYLKSQSQAPKYSKDHFEFQPKGQVLAHDEKPNDNMGLYASYPTQLGWALQVEILP
jgi:hypothetical protein